MFKFGIRAKRGYGWVTNPKRFVKNKIRYRITTLPYKLLKKLFKW